MVVNDGRTQWSHVSAEPLTGTRAHHHHQGVGQRIGASFLLIGYRRSTAPIGGAATARHRSCRQPATRRELRKLNAEHDREIAKLEEELRRKLDKAEAESSTLRLTTSHPLNLLSMARLNSARSRIRPPSCNLVRIAQTCRGCPAP